GGGGRGGLGALGVEQLVERRADDVGCARLGQHGVDGQSQAALVARLGQAGEALGDAGQLGQPVGQPLQPLDGNVGRQPLEVDHERRLEVGVAAPHADGLAVDVVDGGHRRVVAVPPLQLPAPVAGDVVQPPHGLHRGGQARRLQGGEEGVLALGADRGAGAGAGAGRGSGWSLRLDFGRGGNLDLGRRRSLDLGGRGGRNRLGGGGLGGFGGGGLVRGGGGGLRFLNRRAGKRGRRPRSRCPPGPRVGRRGGWGGGGRVGGGRGGRGG